MFRLTAECASAIIEEEAALATLRSLPVEAVLAAVDDIDSVHDEDGAFQALMGAMHALRPQGWL